MKPGKSNSYLELFRTFNSIKFHGLMPPFIQRNKEVAHALTL